MSLRVGVAFASWLAVAEAGKRFHGHKVSHDKNAPFEHIVSQRPHEDPIFMAGLPDSLDWRHMGGVDYMASVKNQHEPGPTYCGACWAFATTGHLNARFNIARGNAWPRMELAVQLLVSCGPAMPNGCGGSDPDMALKYIHEYGLPHESCHTYQGKNLACDAYNMCQDCMSGYDPVCWARPKFPLFKVKEYGTIRPDGDISAADPVERKAAIDGMVLKMKAEIAKRGPMVCQIACPDPAGGDKVKVPFRTQYSRDTYGDVRGYMDDYTPFFNMVGPDFEPFILNSTFGCPSGDWDSCVDHDIVVAGWGRENGVPYWIIQNSWGEWWGEGGYVRVIMGSNNLGIESACFWGVPDMDGFEEDKHGLQKFPVGTAESFQKRFEEYQEMTKPKTVYEKVTTLFS